MVAIMNFHFTTTKAHVTRCGGEVLELVHKKGLLPQSDDPFKGDFDLRELKKTIREYGPEKVAYVRVEAGTNLIGGQPVSPLEILREEDFVAEREASERRQQEMEAADTEPFAVWLEKHA